MHDRDNEFINRLIQLLLENFADSNMNAAFLARKMGVCRTSLFLKVRDITRMSLGEFIRLQRMKYAVELLLEKEYNITETSYMIGYSSQKHFSVAFKRYFGDTPSNFIKCGDEIEQEFALCFDID